LIKTDITLTSPVVFLSPLV